MNLLEFKLLLLHEKEQWLFPLTIRTMASLLLPSKKVRFNSVIATDWLLIIGWHYGAAPAAAAIQRLSASRAIFTSVQRNLIIKIFIINRLNWLIQIQTWIWTSQFKQLFNIIVVSFLPGQSSLSTGPTTKWYQTLQSLPIQSSNDILSSSISNHLLPWKGDKQNGKGKKWLKSDVERVARRHDRMK